MTAKAVLDAARAKRLTIATAESCTGGMIAAALTDLPGSSDVFQGGFVTYSNALKTALIGVKPNTISAFGAVSEDVAREMAVGARARTGCDIAVSVTGIAGPGGSEHKPEGRVCFGWATVSGTMSQTFEFGAVGRAQVRKATTDHAIAILLTAIDSLSPNS